MIPSLPWCWCYLSHSQSCKNYRWWFPEMGVLLVIIHLNGMFHDEPSFLGYLHDYGSPHDQMVYMVYDGFRLKTPQKIIKHHWKSPIGSPEVATSWCPALTHGAEKMGARRAPWSSEWSLGGFTKKTETCCRWFYMVLYDSIVCDMLLHSITFLLHW